MSTHAIGTIVRATSPSQVEGKTFALNASRQWVNVTNPAESYSDDMLDSYGARYAVLVAPAAQSNPFESAFEGVDTEALRAAQESPSALVRHVVENTEEDVSSSIRDAVAQAQRVLQDAFNEATRIVERAL